MKTHRIRRACKAIGLYLWQGLVITGWSFYPYGPFPYGPEDHKHSS